MSYGHIFTAMLLNSSGFTGRTLHMYREFFDDKPVSKFIGKGGEKGFRSLKSPDFLASTFYLIKPERIEALLMVMKTCLMVFAALEH